MALQLAVQLYSVREPMQKSPIETLKNVMKAGYRCIEPANPWADKDPGIGFGISSSDLLKVMKPYGASITSTHIGPLAKELLPEVVAYHNEIGNRNIVKAIEFYTSYDHLMRACEEYNQIGKYLVEHEMNPMLYHNHYHEYQLVHDKPILYHIMENTDPQYVNLELDTGWVMRAGQNPISEMEYLKDRVKMIHIKDFAYKPANLLIGKNDFISWETFGANSQPGDVMKPEDFVELGTGIMPIQEIINKANQLGFTYAVLEQDECAGDIIESISKSYNNLNSFQNITL